MEVGGRWMEHVKTEAHSVPWRKIIDVNTCPKDWISQSRAATFSGALAGHRRFSSFSKGEANSIYLYHNKRKRISWLLLYNK